jgi:hypothetical protein
MAAAGVSAVICERMEEPADASVGAGDQVIELP